MGLVRGCIGIHLKQPDLRRIALESDGIQRQDSRLNPDRCFNLFLQRGLVGVQLRGVDLKLR